MSALAMGGHFVARVLADPTAGVITGPSSGQRIVDAILRDPSVHVVPQSMSPSLPASIFYAARPDKGYSLTDCISMQTMRREGLIEVLTNDRHFEQEGFRALFRDSY